MSRRRAAHAIVVALFVLGACGYDWTVTPKTTTPDAAAPTGTCSSRSDCAKDEYCVFDDFLCGEGREGSCSRVPPVIDCNDELEVVCGCDSVLYKRRCTARSFGADFSANVDCELLPGEYRCGFLVCGKDQFCIEFSLDGGMDYRCIGWSCSERSCACSEPTDQCPGATCEPVKGGGVIAHCPR